MENIMTREEIQAQIDIVLQIKEDISLYEEQWTLLDGTRIELEHQILSSKSIQEIKQEEFKKGFVECHRQMKKNEIKILKEAFEAGRLGLETTIDYFYSHGAKYDTFEDYIKSKS